VLVAARGVAVQVGPPDRVSRYVLVRPVDVAAVDRDCEGNGTGSNEAGVRVLPVQVGSADRHRTCPVDEVAIDRGEAQRGSDVDEALGYARRVASRVCAADGWAA